MELVKEIQEKFELVCAIIDGKNILIGNSAGVLSIWDSKTFDILSNAHIPNPITSICIFKEFICLGDSKGHIYFVSKEFVVTKQWKGHMKKINHLLYVENRIWSCSNDLTIKIWEIQTNQTATQLTAVTHHRVITTLSIVSNQIWGAGEDGLISIWSKKGFVENEMMNTLHSKTIRAICCLNDSIVLTGGYDKKVVLWRLGE